MATNDSYLIPHYDSTAHDNKIKKSYNFIYFIDGYDGDLNTSGATGIYQDNEFRMPIFIPNNIKNSVLIYNTKSTDHYHGFKNIKCPRSVYRKTINFHSVIFKEN